ncbi:MAG: hypothetical protein GYA81_04065, partial [Chloroflexi bacterium]|nr:hypothetical protein [Chloroflexota bacterium]
TDQLASAAGVEQPASRNARELAAKMEAREMEKMLKEMEKQMRAAAAELQFERAAMLRDQIYELRALLVDNSNLPPWKKQELLAGRDD